MKDRPVSDVKDIDNRLATIEGHIKAIRQMYAENKDCEDILLQLYATSGALKKLSKKIIIEHLSTCVTQSIRDNDDGVLEGFKDILEKYI